MQVGMLLFLIGSQVAAGLIAVLIWRRYCSPLHDVPGPVLASISRLWHLKHIVKGDSNLQVVALHEKHGPFVRIAHNEVSVRHPDGVRKILMAPLHKAKGYKIFAVPDYRFRTGLSETNPQRKMELSKHLAPGYAMSNILQSESAVDDVVSIFLDRLDGAASSAQPIQLDQLLTYTAFDAVGEIIFSRQFGFISQGKDISNAIANNLYVNMYASIMWFFLWVHILLFGNPFVTWLNILPLGHLYETSARALDNRFDNHDSRFDAVEHWMRSMEKNSEKLTRSDIYSAATGAIGAGSDTISCATQAFVYFMMRHPSAWERASREIEEARNLHGTCQGRVVQYADAKRLPFLQACIKEALRVFGPAHMNFPRIVPKEGVTIGGRYFGEGTILSVNAWAMHHSKEFWGDDASSFDPDRWLTADASSLDKYFIPWGMGYNSCPGQNIAKLEISKIAASLVRDYCIRQVDENREWKWKAYFTLVPHSWPVVVKRRNDEL